jgi:hypothetical protein
LLVLDARHEERFEPAAVRWAGRLATEVPGLELAELAGALESLVALPGESAQAARHPLCTIPALLESLEQGMEHWPSEAARAGRARMRRALVARPDGCRSLRVAL